MSEKTKNPVFGDLVKPIISLLLICLVAAGLLGAANAVTKAPIEELAAKNAMEAKQKVLPDAQTFDEEGREVDGALAFAGYAADGSVAGYVFETKTNSYGGKLVVMTGVGNDGAVRGVTITEINDTPGLGLKAKTDPTFLTQYAGKSGVVGVVKNADDKTDGDIVAITSATISSKAVTTAVNAALSAFDAITGGAENE